jgi:arsenite methyltransferase
MSTPIHDVVRDHYARAALSVIDGHEHGENAACCGTPNYSTEELASLPGAAALASLGCGNPLMVADLHEGERVLDLGSGGGIDVLLSAKRVGPTGRAFGLDMTDEMLALAARNTAEAGATNVEFLKGEIEAIPLPADSIDVVISNCVINLAADKSAVFREIARVLRPGGRMGVSDNVAYDSLTPAERAERGSYVGCIAGAPSFSEYEAGLREAGLEDISITRSQEETEGMVSAIIRARKSETAVAVTKGVRLMGPRQRGPRVSWRGTGCGYRGRVEPRAGARRVEHDRAEWEHPRSGRDPPRERRLAGRPARERNGGSEQGPGRPRRQRRAAPHADRSPGAWQSRSAHHGGPRLPPHRRAPRGVAASELHLSRRHGGQDGDDRETGRHA